MRMNHVYTSSWGGQYAHAPNSLAILRAAFTMFLEDADTMRLLVYLDGKDLVAVRYKTNAR